MAKTKAIVVSVPAELSTDLSVLAASATRYAERAASKATRRGYASDWKGFEAWCAQQGVPALPATPQAVALYFAHLADSGKSYQTISRIRFAIGWVHSQHTDSEGRPVSVPTRHAKVKTVLRGIANTIGRGKRRQKSAATVDDILRPMVEALPPGNRGDRDRAVILLGFSGAFRRSDLASLRIEDIEVMDDGAVVHLKRSKTDQAGVGAEVPIPRADDPALCPVRALEQWLRDLQNAGITDGFLVRGVHKSGTILFDSGGATDRTVNRIVKSAAESAGIDADTLGAHSLRAGFATQAGIKNKNVLQIAAQGRWKKVDTVMGYMRVGRRFKDSAAKGLL